MKASGLLTDEEFSLAKAKLLGLTGSPTGQLVQESIQPTDPKPHQFNGPIQTNKKTIPTPNKDWRNVKITSSGPNALSKRSTDENSFDNIRSSYNDPIAARTAGGFTKSSSVNDDQDIEFDYADFESAVCVVFSFINFYVFLAHVFNRRCLKRKAGGCIIQLMWVAV